MDTNLLRTFVTVTRYRSFSVAASELGYTQSAVSQQIAALEQHLGVPLLHRRPVSPTPAGERLLEHAGPILLRLDAARADVRRSASDVPGELTIAATPLAASTSLPRALSAVRRERAGLTVQLHVHSAATVVHGVSAGEYDVGLVDGVAAPSDPLKFPVGWSLRSTGIAQLPLALALPSTHPLSSRPRLRLAALVDARWIDAVDIGPALADLRAAAETDSLRPALTYAGTDVATLLHLVAQGHGLAVLPTSIAVPAGVTTVPLTAARLVHRTELVHGATPSAAVAQLAAALGASPATSP